jgi:hypothetical protein
MVAEFPERGMQWVKDRVETVVNETGEYVREKPTQSLFYAFAVGYVLNRLPLGRVLAGLLRLLFMALKPAILIYGAAKLYRSAQEREAPSARVEAVESLERASEARGILLFQRKPDL